MRKHEVYKLDRAILKERIVALENTNKRIAYCNEELLVFLEEDEEIIRELEDKLKTYLQELEKMKYVLAEYNDLKSKNADLRLSLDDVIDFVSNLYPHLEDEIRHRVHLISVDEDK